ncbi:SDR family oxidoreductase [Rhizobiales bacterium]|uniref:SDR family NAD(P)-dependent oxidoreductase n=1 Tax=Hongsoonwoonella zoysiae TaxID=2821844 RepID=UPI00155F6FDC|nr:SDR family oxidoreductase [Hongsoonwoonella zoysiae]NRG16433.1 SDR family oxidoreductase [Hongsoonwoonella zoysiae]
MDFGSALRGRRILITGASSGLGMHFARLSARQGAKVAIAARRRERLEDLCKELLALGAERALASTLDVSDETSIDACIADVVEAFDGLDVLVNNAGTASGGTALDQTAEDFDQVVNVNLRGVWLLSTAAGRHWRDTATPGAIVNIASILGERVAKGVAPYAISKAGVVQMTKVLALELSRHDIRVNAIAPGYFETEINAGFFDTPQGAAMIKRIPMRRTGKPEELDGPFILLASDASRYMTGAVIPVDGGHLVSSL